jgi:nucleotide-binding universal stress UspA family protein
MMSWIVGTGLGKRSRGALAFSRWLAEAAGVRWRDVFVPVHVLAAEHLRAALRAHHLDEVVEDERSAVILMISELLRGEPDRVEVVQAATVEEGLEDARRRLGATGVIVARAASRESRSVLRLGGIARRLLHRLESPVIVVPPDLTASAVGDGPFVAAASLGDDSVPACRLARALADAARRDLTILHVAGDRSGEAVPPDRPRLRDLAAGPLGPADHALARWVERHGVWPDLAVVTDGKFPATAAAYSEARRAALVVVGAEPGVSVTDALARKSWRWLAAHARQPVLVVPARPAVLAPALRADGGGAPSPGQP